MKRELLWPLFVGLLCLALQQSSVATDVVTLNSGQQIAGQITSENDTQLVIEVSNASQTIFTSKSVSKSLIQSVQREAAEAKQERLAYEAIQKYQLYPDQELTTTQCDAQLAVCLKFLEAFPRSDHAEAVRLKSEEFKNEKEQVEKGLVKIANRWMTVIQKVTEQDLRVCLEKMQRMQRDLTNLEKQRDLTVNDYASAKLGVTQASAEYYETRKKEDQYRHSAAAQRKALCEGQVQQAQELLRNIESKITRARSDLVSAQREYETAKAKRDKLLISAVPVIKPVPANNSVITPTAAVPVTQAPQAATVIFLAQTVSPPPQKRLTIDVTNDNERRIREQKQKQELAQVQTERDRQVLIGKPTQDPLQSMFGPLFAYSGESYQ